MANNSSEYFFQYKQVCFSCSVLLCESNAKYTGSLEFFAQPELAVGSNEYSGFNKTGIGVGSRINIPLNNYGEHLYMSLGGKYTFRKNEAENVNGYYGVEGGVYAIFGILGLQVNYNFNENSRYNFGIYFKYW